MAAYKADSINLLQNMKDDSIREFVQNKADVIEHLIEDLQINDLSHYESVCTMFSQSVFDNNRSNALRALYISAQFLLNNNNQHRTLVAKDQATLSQLIDIFERAQIFKAIKFILPTILNQQDFAFLIQLLYFIYQIYKCHSYFQQYLADQIFFDLVFSIHQIVTFSQFDIQFLFFQLFSGLFPFISIESIEYTFLRSEILRYLVFLSDVKPLFRIPSFISTILIKFQSDFGLYSFVIDYFVHDDYACITSESFLAIISSLYVMITKDRNLSDNVVHLILTNKIHRSLFTVYKDYQLDSSFSLFLTLNIEILQFYLRNPEIDNTILVEKTTILKFFSYEDLYEKLKGFDSNISSCIIEYASLLLDLNSIMDVFHKQGEFVDLIILIYDQFALKCKEKALKLFLKMINYSKFFRNRILSIDLSDTFILFLDNRDDTQIDLLLNFIEISLQLFNIKQIRPPILDNLLQYEDFIPTFIEASEEISNDNLKSRMQIALSQFDQILNQ